MGSNDYVEQFSELKSIVETLVSDMKEVREFLIGDKIKDPNKPSMLDEHIENTRARESFIVMEEDIKQNTKFRKNYKKWLNTLAVLFAGGVFKEWIPGLLAWASTFFQG